MKIMISQEDTAGRETLDIISGAQKFNRWMYEAIRPHVKGLVLELGSGTGNISVWVLEDKFETVLSDYNREYVHYLKDRFKDYPNLQAILQLNLQSSEFEHEHAHLFEKFDTIFLLNVIEHLEHDNDAVSNCRFLLRPGGTLVLLAPAYRFLYCDLDRNLGHFRRYTTSSLAALLERNGLNPVEKKYFNLAGIAGWLIWGKMLRTQQLRAGSMKIFNLLVPLFRLADLVTIRKIGLSAIVAAKKI